MTDPTPGVESVEPEATEPEATDPETVEPAATEPEATDAATTDAEAAPAGRTRRALVLGGRLVMGTAAVATAVVVIGIVGLAPLPHYVAAIPAVEVVPAPADEVRVCPGSVLRLGEETGADAGTPVPIDEANVRAEALEAELRRDPLAESDAGSGGTAAAPSVLSIAPAEGAFLSGAQSQRVEARDFVGFTAAACAEPSGSVWLVGGATTVGRSTLLTLSNPTAVAATVDLEIFGEVGRISAPGLGGIDVPAGTQRVLSLAGFAPGLVAPVVHVEARGGQVLATLQQSIVRGLDATGVDLVGPVPSPDTDLRIPGVRVRDAIGVNRALALADWEDVAPILRLLVPGDEPAQVRVSVIPEDPDHEGASFELDVEGGTVVEVPLDAGETATGHGLEDGIYTVTIESDVPLVGAVRVSTAVDSGVDPAPDAILEAPPSDVAWFVPAPRLGGDLLVTVARGPDPVLSATNPTDEDVTLVLEGQGTPDLELLVPAGASASVPAESGESYLLRGVAGLAVAVGFAADGELAGYVIAPARPVAGPIVVHPY